MDSMPLIFRVHETMYSIYKLKGIPDAAFLSAGTDFLSLSIAPSETTLICASDLHLTGCEIDQDSRNWRCLEVASEHPVDVVGLIAFASVMDLFSNSDFNALS